MHCVSLLLLCGALAAPPDQGPPLWSGEVHTSTVEDGVLVERPLPGATVVLGRGLRLRAGADGRDELSATPSTEPGGRSPFAITTTDGEGRYALEEPSGEGALDLLVWCTGHTPILRQTASPEPRSSVTLTRGGASDLHRSLLRPDGLLVLPQPTASQGLPFVEPGSGFLYLPPPGYVPAPHTGSLTLARFLHGSAEIRLIRAPGPVDPSALEEELAAQTTANAPDARLLRSGRVEVDRRWATVREYRGATLDTCAVYLASGRTALVVGLSAPRDAYPAASEAFTESLQSVRFPGPKPPPSEFESSVRSRELGLELGLPEGWRLEEDSPSLLRIGSAEQPVSEVHAWACATPTEGPARLVAEALAGLTTRGAPQESWELVAGCPTRVATVTTRPAPGHGARTLRVLAIYRGDETVVLRLEGPRSLTREQGDLLATLQESVRFVSRVRSAD